MMITGKGSSRGAAGVIPRLLLVLALSVLGSCAAQADRGGGTPDRFKLWDSHSLLTRVISSHYGVDRVIVSTIGQKTTDPDDVSVTFFLSRLGSIGPHDVYRKRVKSVSWMAIMQEGGIDEALLFTEVKATPVPEAYAHAYRELTKRRADPSYRMELYDKEIRNLVQLKLVTARYGLSAEQVMRLRSAGASFTDLVINKELSRSQPPALQKTSPGQPPQEPSDL